MPHRLNLSCCLLIILQCAVGLAQVATQPTANAKQTFVLVHGAWGGGYHYKTLDNLLSADGYKVYRPTLTGQGERFHLSSPDIDLTTHINDIVNVILWEDLHDVILVGHSYGGMVITGVADRVSDRLKRVVYLDAFLPESGQSLNTARPAPTTGPGARRGAGRGPSTNGMRSLGNFNPNAPLPHDVPQSEKTFSEVLVLNNQDKVAKIPTSYILTVDPGRQPQQDTFYFFYERARARGWDMHTMEGDHNIMVSHPKELKELLEKIAD